MDQGSPRRGSESLLILGYEKQKNQVHLNLAKLCGGQSAAGGQSEG